MYINIKLGIILIVELKDLYVLWETKILNSQIIYISAIVLKVRC